jgi:hypothetical protein
MAVVQLSLARKTSIAALGLAALVAWPPMHFRLVERYNLNPWKFFGFAMYCVPTLPVQLDIRLVEEGSEIQVRDVPAPLRAICRRFAIDRSVLGTFRDPRPIARWILRARPSAEAVRIDVLHSRLDPATDRIVEARDPREYRRVARPADSGAAVRGG